MVSRVLLTCGLSLLAASAQGQGGLLIDGEAFRDPTRPPRANVVQVPGADNATSRGYEVTFIRAGSESSAAVINGTLVTVGDSIDGATVQAIGTDSVTLDVAGQTVEINAFRAGFRSSAN